MARQATRKPADGEGASGRSHEARAAERPPASGWRPIATAPMNGDPVLLFLDPPLDTNRTIGWATPDEMRVVAGWWCGVWQCGFCEEGKADSNGDSSIFLIDVHPTHWMPLPEPPA